MKSIKIKSRAKVNITLDVLNKRDDGYHDVKMIMQTIALSDDIYIERIRRGIYLKTNLPYLPTNEKNIAYKAAQLFFKSADIDNVGIRINIYKRIPVAAGLAGGSSNAAAVLIALNKMFKTEYSKEKLIKIGKELGADVPYCIIGGTVLAEGIGNIFTLLPLMPRSIIVLAKPNVRLSTAKVYQSLNCDKIQKRPNTGMVINAIYNQDKEMIAKEMYNVLEEKLANEHKVIGKIKRIMIEDGALGAIMSGSGPTVFGIFNNEIDAYKATKRLSKITRDVFVTHTIANSTF